MEAQTSHVEWLGGERMGCFFSHPNPSTRYVSEETLLDISGCDVEKNQGTQWKVKSATPDVGPQESSANSSSWAPRLTPVIVEEK